MTTLIKNCRLVSPGIDVTGAAIAIEGDRIRQVYRPGTALPSADVMIDAEGMLVMPGFIDMHFHGAAGHDATDGDYEGIKEMAQVKVREGVTTAILTTLTTTEEQLSAGLRAIAAYMLSPNSLKIPGVHLEGPYINPQWTGSMNPAHVRTPDFEEVMRLNAIARVLKVSFAIELDGGLEFAAKLKAAGIMPSCGHSNATYAELRAAKVVGVNALTHFCNQMRPLHHREIGLVGGGLYDDDILVELICDKVHLCPDMIALAFKVKPIDRIALITDAILASGLRDGTYDLGGLPIYVKNGEARQVSNNALAGSTLKFNTALRNVYEITGLPLKELVKTTAWNQAQALGLDGLGRIEPGYYADLVVMDDDFMPVMTLVDGVNRL